MIWHPYLLCLLVLDSIGLVSMLAAGMTAFRIVLHWSPSSASEKQLRLERKAETAWIGNAWGIGLFFIATVLLIVGIANVLPAVVPGAMCGTGVMQATAGEGRLALGFRFLAIGIMSVWMLLNRLNRMHPHSPLTLPTARIALVLLPVVLMAYQSTFSTILHLDYQQPVDCCAAVYDRVGSIIGKTHEYGPSTFRLAAFFVGGVFLAGLGLALGFIDAHRSLRKLGLFFGAAVLVWVPIAYTSFIGVFVSYYYGVLAHHCPWCLFLAEHKLAGYPLFGALAVIGMEGPITAASCLISDRFPGLREHAAARRQTAGKRTAAAVLVFLLLSVLPPLVWRLRFGVWMGG